MKYMNPLLKEYEDIIKEFSFYAYDHQNDLELSSQAGIFRTNCLDCLDRTNVF